MKARHGELERFGLFPRTGKPLSIPETFDISDCLATCSPLAITERDFSTQIEDLLKMFGWKYVHFRAARTEHGWRTAMSGSKGFLDYIALRPPRIVVFELKSEQGKMTSEQQEWFNLWEQCQKPLLLEPLELKEGKASVTLKAGQKILTIPEVYIFRPSDFERITEILR